MNIFVLILTLSISRCISAVVLNDIIQCSFPPLKKCLHVLTDKDDHYVHILKIFHSNMFPVLNTLTMTSEQNLASMNCEDYVSECKDVDELLEHIEYLKLLTNNITNHKNMRFLIFVHLAKEAKIKTEDLSLNILIIRKHTYRSVFISEFNNSTSGKGLVKYTLTAPLTNKTILINSTNYLKNPHMMQALFDEQRIFLNSRSVNGRTFRISLFECPPFVIYGKDQMDGIEYRIIKEVMKNRKLQVLKRDFTENISDPWSAVKEDVVKNRSDLAMCSIWLTAGNWLAMDFSQQYNSLCATFLVPKPILINPSTYLFLPLSWLVWIGLMISIVITMTWLYLVASADKLTENSSPYASIAYCFMRVIEMATLHGLNNIPRQMSFKIMITFWMVTCILLSTAYSSGYTSLLTCPQYGRKTETLKDMLNAGVYWGDVHHNIIEEWSDNEYFIKVSQRRRFQKNTQELIGNIKRSNYAIFVKRLGDDYVTDTERYQNVSKYLSCLKECIAQYYVVFALQKNSYYKDIINKRLIQLLESGIVRHWQADIVRKYTTSYMKHFFDEYTKAKNEPFSLSMSHTRGAFYLLAVGLLLSKIFFINEIFGIIRFHPIRLPVNIG